MVNNKKGTENNKRFAPVSRFVIKLASVIAAFLFSVNAISLAQSQDKRLVLTVQVKGNQAISSATVLTKIKTKPGDMVSQDIINDDIKRLYALGYFTDVAIDIEDYEEGVMLTVIVEEKPVIKVITFSGNEKMRTARLKKDMKIKDGDMLNYSKLSEDITELKALYERSGFSQVTITYELEKDEELNQVTVNILVEEKKRMRIQRVFVEGNDSVKKNSILELMQTRTAWFFRRGYFDDEVFENDLAKIKMFYEDRGFLDVVITPEFDYEEDKGLMQITIKITEGAQYKVGKIVLKGNLVLPEKDVRGKITIKEGDSFSYSKLREDVESVRELYYREGYMNAEIFVDRMLKPDIRELDIVFDVKGKEIVNVGRINISGNSKTKDVVIRRELRIYPGERFDGEKIRRSKERLYNLGYFEDIYFETQPTDKPSINDLDISVKETKTGEFAFGGGYSSVDEFIGFVQVTQKNFDLLNFPYFTGDGQILSIKAELGTVRSDYDISWTEPWIFDYPLAFGFDAYHRTHQRKTHVGYGFNETRSGGDVRLGKEFLEYFTASLMYRLENVDISDVPTEATQDFRDEEGQNWLSSLMGGVQFDNRDSVFSPTKGIIAGTSLETTGGILAGDKDYLKGFFYGSAFYSPISKIVVELKGRAGLASSYGSTDKVPIYERYYAGGANTIRGYRERKVGPRDTATSDPIGGEATLIGNVELTFPIYEKVIKGAVFYDVGNVWAELEDFGKGDYKQGTGVGIRVKTPIGPVKIDWGYPLSKNQGDEQEGQFYFSMSHGF
ncbi:MAG: outer membrane protein assembly factor BamA [Candidatus Omnitrophota bacterium]